MTGVTVSGFLYRVLNTESSRFFKRTPTHCKIFHPLWKGTLCSLHWLELFCYTHHRLPQANLDMWGGGERRSQDVPWSQNSFLLFFVSISFLLSQTSAIFSHPSGQINSCLTTLGPFTERDCCNQTLLLFQIPREGKLIGRVRDHWTLQIQSSLARDVGPYVHTWLLDAGLCDLAGQ